MPGHHGARRQRGSGLRKQATTRGSVPVSTRAISDESRPSTCARHVSAAVDGAQQRGVARLVPRVDQPHLLAKVLRFLRAQRAHFQRAVRRRGVAGALSPGRARRRASRAAARAGRAGARRARPAPRARGRRCARSTGSSWAPPGAGASAAGEAASGSDEDGAARWGGRLLARAGNGRG